MLGIKPLAKNIATTVATASQSKMPELLNSSDNDLLLSPHMARKQSQQSVHPPNPNKNVSLGGLLGVPSEIIKKRGLGSMPMSPKALKITAI